MAKKTLKQSDTPFLSAMEHYVQEEVSPFDVPGHHLGNVDNPAFRLFGKQIYRYDLNSPFGMDNLAKPQGVIYQSEKLLAEACGADDAFFLVNGTTEGILAMIMASCRAGEKIILPRNVHKSVINALVLSGAYPVYVMPEIDADLEIANQPSVEAYRKAILHNPSAKAVLVINPTYFGAVADLRSIAEIAHEHHMAVLTDEAHGAHYYFGAKGSPLTAMEAGADLSAVSFHKTAGSLTQSSVLLMREGYFDREGMQKVLNILATTSPSSLLMGSIDGARAFLASREGRVAMEKTIELVRYARSEIAKIPGFIPVEKEHFMAHGAYDYDISKLVIALEGIDLTGFELYRLLKREYSVQMELAETYAIMGVFAIGSRKTHVDHLVEALKDISAKHYRPGMKYPDHAFESNFPYMLVRPRSAFHAPGKAVPLEECDGAVSKEQVMMYPPGIPLICPGEVWTKELVEKVKRLTKDGVSLLSSHEKGFEIIDVAKWKRYSVYEKRLNDYFRKRMTLPVFDGYRLPFEGERHQATFILLPYRSDTWRKKAEPAKEEFREIIKAISEHEPVIVGIHPRIWKSDSPEYEAMENVTPICIRYGDAWARDTFPLFLTNGESLRTADFRFNAWGGDYDGLYGDYRDDDRLGALISKRYHLLSYRLNEFVLEGGSVAADGEGTAIVTEACLLSKGRNPTLTKEQIEEVLREFLSLEKVIWVPHGIYLDETNEHIDNMLAFVRPGEVAMASCSEKSDPQYEYCVETYKALKKATDAHGRKLKINLVPLPDPAICETKEEAKGLRKLKDTKEVRKEGRRLSASYINFYQGHDFVILPKFGVKEDETAYNLFREMFPEKKIHPVYAREILLGGGGIHCVTMQYPGKERP